uniref:Uncharacterized protein n=1 Tax=Rhizophora mucronata TaxID=61149 RepID=A0A2P2IWN1_RHIMU
MLLVKIAVLMLYNIRFTLLYQFSSNTVCGYIFLFVIVFLVNQTIVFGNLLAS